MKLNKAIIMTLGLALLSFSFLNTHAEQKTTANTDVIKRAIFAGGCFWCMEPPFDKLDGVISTISGYAGGHMENPTYKTVSAGISGHAEVLQITYDSNKISYQELLDVFWINIDPTTPDRQFCDKGHQYRTGIFYLDGTQKQLAEQSLEKLKETKPFKQDILTEISPLTKFYAAEDYHQDYYQKNPVRYKYYRFACGRDKRLEQLWGKMKS